MSVYSHRISKMMDSGEAFPSAIFTVTGLDTQLASLSVYSIAPSLKCHHRSTSSVSRSPLDDPLPLLNGAPEFFAQRVVGIKVID